MALLFISIGLNDERDMSIKALGTARSCDLLFAELYTSKLDTSKERLESFIGKPLTLITRKDLEEDYQKILKEAEGKNVGLLVGGDALVSTAHAALMAEAKKKNIETKVIHGSSIVAAVSEAGLHMQKFGQMITIPFLDRTKGSLPISVYEVISENKKRGLHTLCLLDMIAEESKFMKVDEALAILLGLEKSLKRKAISKKSELVVFSRLGSGNQKIAYGKLENILGKSFGEEPYSIVVLGKLHFSEKDCLERL